MNLAVFRIFFLTGLFLLKTGYSVLSQKPESHPEDTYDELYQSVRNAFGFNQVLGNGIFYVNRYLRALGNLFFSEDRFEIGSLIFRDKVYQGIEISQKGMFFNYVIYSENDISYPACNPGQASSHIPDLRNTLCWQHYVSVVPGKITTISFCTSDIKGDFDIFARGLMDDNKSVIYGICSFK